MKKLKEKIQFIIDNINWKFEISNMKSFLLFINFLLLSAKQDTELGRVLNIICSAIWLIIWLLEMIDERD